MTGKKLYLGTNVTYFRKLHKLTSTDLATMIGITPAKLSLIETSLTTDIDYYLIETLADYFGCTTEGLVRSDLTNNSVTGDAQDGNNTFH
ncbi:helix-turn-helix transcriptional regulator [uncultured Methylophaga sp.]|jgi:transcriptional regulator with XRE-family HTH domain|uniref:helix-turn-helix domain-containing protein n=1 Tax=Methylophaga sp. TaxID=2024840 RepID=UPI0030F6CCD2|tara:strand:+ start:434 stop:703 length:270 start_codon:yes stop_codon:yes gene_type:complete